MHGFDILHALTNENWDNDIDLWWNVFFWSDLYTKEKASPLHTHHYVYQRLPYASFRRDFHHMLRETEQEKKSDRIIA